MFGQDLTSTLIRIFVLVISLSVHEAAHAWMAYRFGDSTARRMGRLTLNPLAHFDPVGAMLILFAPIGWAKPVPVDPRYVRNAKVGLPLIAFAGPLSNILLALLGCIGYAIADRLASGYGWQVLTSVFVVVNISLALFNLIPVFPLDGSKVLSLFLPDHVADRYEETMMRFGMWPLVALILWSFTLGGGPITWWFHLWRPVVRPVLQLFGMPAIF